MYFRKQLVLLYFCHFTVILLFLSHRSMKRLVQIPLKSCSYPIVPEQKSQNNLRQPSPPDRRPGCARAAQNSCENEKSCISSGSETRCALCRIIWMPRITTPTTRPSTSGPKRNNAFARRWSLTVSFFVQILYQSGVLCKTNLNTLLCKVTFLFRAFLL